MPHVKRHVLRRLSQNDPILLPRVGQSRLVINVRIFIGKIDYYEVSGCDLILHVVHDRSRDSDLVRPYTVDTISRYDLVDNAMDEIQFRSKRHDEEYLWLSAHYLNVLKASLRLVGFEPALS